MSNNNAKYSAPIIDLFVKVPVGVPTRADTVVAETLSAFKKKAATQRPQVFSFSMTYDVLNNDRSVNVGGFFVGDVSSLIDGTFVIVSAAGTSEDLELYHTPSIELRDVLEFFKGKIPEGHGAQAFIYPASRKPFHRRSIAGEHTVTTRNAASHAFRSTDEAIEDLRKARSDIRGYQLGIGDTSHDVAAFVLDRKMEQSSFGSFRQADFAHFCEIAYNELPQIFNEIDRLRAEVKRLKDLQTK